LTFFILVVSNFNDLVVSWVDKLFIFEFEHLEPSRVGAPYLHVSGSTSTLNIPGLVV
jgi:hypothetical protein